MKHQKAGYEIGMVGLGVMGRNLALNEHGRPRLLGGGL
jgi:6-phosphogluconate dehydrogenase